jgi:hypothetical protein
MANFRAIRGVTEAIIHLLRTSYDPTDFDNELEFRVFTARDFSSPISNGVSLFLYRLYGFGTQRTPPGRLAPSGERLQTELPLELHFLLTFWGREASLQHTIAGWAMRALEDSPVIPAGVLNTVASGMFHDDENIQICLAELRTEDLFRIWDVLDVDIYQLSVPYLARVVSIESVHEAHPVEGGAVQDRTLQAAVIGDAESLSEV